MSDVPQTKVELIERIEAGYAAIENRLAPLSDTQLTTCTAPGEWSIKDHVAHLMIYERGMVALLRHEPRWAAMQLSMKFVRDSESFDEINAVLYEHYCARPASEVLAALRDVHQELLQVLAGLMDEDLFKPYAA